MKVQRAHLDQRLRHNPYCANTGGRKNGHIFASVAISERCGALSEMAYNMREEDDLLETRKSSSVSTMASERSISGLSTRSAVSSISVDGRLLSYATSQATIAARSILVSGGTEETALQTAKAAAQAVLLAHHESHFRKGPKGFVRKRKIKKQADIIASMAVVSASNSINNNKWDSLHIDGSSDQLHEMFSGNGNSNLVSVQVLGVNKPPKSNKNASNQAKAPRPARTPKTVDTIPEERAEFSVLSDETSDPEIARPVAIRIETTKRRTSPLKVLQSKANLVKVNNGRQTVRSPENTKQILSPSGRNRNLADNLPHEDPIYAASANNYNAAASSASDDDVSERKAVAISSVSTDSLVSKNQETGENSVASNSSFMAKAVDPYIFGFTDVFRCFGSTTEPTSPVARDIDDAYEPEVDEEKDETRSAQLEFEESKSESRIASPPSSFVVDEAPTNSSNETEETREFFSDIDRGISDESSEVSSVHHKPTTAKQSLRNKMKQIIGKANRRSGRRLIQERSASSSSSYDDDRGEYSSDSRDDIESEYSYSTSGASSSETEESRRRNSRDGGKGRVNRRQDRNGAKMEVLV